MQFCTVVARNYLSQARVLAETLALHHPDAPVTVLLVDGDLDDVAELADDSMSFLVTEQLDAVGLADIEAMRTFYDVTELSTALKPALLAHLRQRDGGVVIYLDPDIALFAPLAGLEALATEHAIVLTPHVTRPMPRDGLTIDERTIMRAGMFNLGFIAVGPGSEEFLDWWWSRLRTDAVNDPAEGLFTDQRWVDFVPSLFRHIVVREQGWNVAYWNLHERPLSRDGDGRLLAGDVPVVFFHFSGYDPSTPHLLSKHQGPAPRIRVSESAVLVDLLAWYGERLEAHDHSVRSRAAYRWGSVGGAPLTEVVRRMYRRSVLGLEFGEEPGAGAFVDEEAFLEWLNAPVARSATASVNRLHLAIWAARIDLQIAFPHPTGSSLDAIASWFELHADDHVKATIVPLVRATATAEPPVVREPSPGVLVAGYLNAELGVGESARLVLAAARQTGLPVGVLGYRRTLSRQLAAPSLVDRDADVDLAVICVNADQTPNFFADAGHRLPEVGTRAGMWFWEVPDFPAAYHAAFALVDEVWVASQFVADAVAPHTTKPIRVVPLPVIPDPPSSLTRTDLGLVEDGYLFGFACDARSVLARKNPMGVLRAYLDAFPQVGDQQLIIKIMNGGVDLPGLEELRWVARDRPDIRVVDAVWSTAEMRALVQRLDCYVSLHRSEGYGLGLAQAMAQGRPVIATGWSGNMQFMTPTTSYLVPSELVRVGHAPPYPPHSQWAEPDHDSAVDLLRATRARPGSAAAVGERARADLARRFSVGAAGAWLQERAIEASAAVAGPWAEGHVAEGLVGVSR